MGFLKAIIAVIVSIFSVNVLYQNESILDNYPLIKQMILTPEKKCYFIIFVMALFIIFM